MSLLNLDRNEWRSFLSQLGKDINKVRLRSFFPKGHPLKERDRGKKSDANGDWIKHCHNMIGIPYVWGGRSSDGMDCSALLQLSFQAIGINLPRNTDQQQKYMKLSKNFKQLKVNFFSKQIYEKGMQIIEATQKKSFPRSQSLPV